MRLTRKDPRSEARGVESVAALLDAMGAHHPGDAVRACVALIDLLLLTNRPASIAAVIDLGGVEAACDCVSRVVPSDVRHPLGLLAHMLRSRTSCVRRAVAVVPVLLDMLVDPRFTPFASAPASVLCTLTGARHGAVRTAAASHNAVHTLSRFLTDVLPHMARIADSNARECEIDVKNTLINLVSLDYRGRTPVIDAVLSSARLPRVVLAAARENKTRHAKPTPDDAAKIVAAEEAPASDPPCPGVLGGGAPYPGVLGGGAPYPGVLGGGAPYPYDDDWLRATEAEASRIRAAEADVTRQRQAVLPPVLRAILDATQGQCVDCRTRERSVLLRPCGHVHVCGECYERLVRRGDDPACPVCHEPTHGGVHLW